MYKRWVIHQPCYKKPPFVQEGALTHSGFQTPSSFCLRSAKVGFKVVFSIQVKITCPNSVWFRTQDLKFWGNKQTQKNFFLGYYALNEKKVRNGCLEIRQVKPRAYSKSKSLQSINKIINLSNLRQNRFNTNK